MTRGTEIWTLFATLAVVALAVRIFSGIPLLLTMSIAATLLLASAAVGEKNPEARKRLLRLAFLFMPFYLCLGEVLASLRRFIPSTRDVALNRIDGGLSTSIYHWCLQHPAVALPLSFAYVALPLVMAAGWCWRMAAPSHVLRW